MRKDIQIGSDTANLRLVETTVDEVLADLKIKDDCYGKILVATMEAVNNAIVHGNRADSQKNVKVGFEYESKEFLVKVQDEGLGFNPEVVPDPTAPENIENINGRGVFLMRNLADDICFNESGNEVIMKFKIV